MYAFIHQPDVANQIDACTQTSQLLEFDTHAAHQQQTSVLIGFYIDNDDDIKSSISRCRRLALRPRGALKPLAASRRRVDFSAHCGAGAHKRVCSLARQTLSHNRARSSLTSRRSRRRRRRRLVAARGDASESLSCATRPNADWMHQSRARARARPPISAV